MCIQSEGRINVELSPQDIVNCAFENYGCGGGYMIPAADFLATEGVAKASCFPYLEKTDTCSFECKGEEGTTEKFEKYYCKSGTLRIESEIEEI